MYQDQAEDLTTFTDSCVLTNFVVNTTQNTYDKFKSVYAAVYSDVSVSNYFDFQIIYCLISLSNFTNNKEAFDLQIP